MHSDLVLAHNPVDSSSTVQFGSPALAGVVATGEEAEQDQLPSRKTSSVGNRRSSTRYSALNNRLWIGWWAGDEFVLVQASLVNISEGGVLVGINPSPAQGQRVWMRLEGSSTTESQGAVVVDSRWMILKRRFSVRLAFQENCPSGFYSAAFLDLDDEAGH